MRSVLLCSSLALVLGASVAQASTITLDKSDPVRVLSYEWGATSCGLEIGVNCANLTLIEMEGFLIQRIRGFHFHNDYGAPIVSIFAGDEFAGVEIRRADGLSFTPTSAVTSQSSYPVHFNDMLALPLTTFVGPEWQNITALRFWLPPGIDQSWQYGNAHLISLTVEVPAVAEPGLLLLGLTGAIGFSMRRRRFART